MKLTLDDVQQHEPDGPECVGWQCYICKLARAVESVRRPTKVEPLKRLEEKGMTNCHEQRVCGGCDGAGCDTCGWTGELLVERVPTSGRWQEHASPPEGWALGDVAGEVQRVFRDAEMAGVWSRWSLRFGELCLRELRSPESSTTWLARLVLPDDRRTSWRSRGTLREAIEGVRDAFVWFLTESASDQPLRPMELVSATVEMDGEEVEIGGFPVKITYGTVQPPTADELKRVTRVCRDGARLGEPGSEWWCVRVLEAPGSVEVLYQGWQIEERDSVFVATRGPEMWCQPFGVRGRLGAFMALVATIDEMSQPLFDGA